ncbi:hypothetical protein NM604_0973 [Neisseria meningitidis NM604]|nr:hypothetical protein NM604_0973 [Neisseria meningitidis NM604]
MKTAQELRAGNVFMANVLWRSKNRIHQSVPQSSMKLKTC